MEKVNPPNKIRELRVAAGLSQQELADIVVPKTSQPQIDRLEKDERNLTQDWMERIARALKVQPEDLLPNQEGKIVALHPTQQPVATRNDTSLISSPGEPGIDTWKKDLKVLGFVKAGKVGYYPDNGELLEMTKRPPMLEGVPDHLCYAVIVDDTSMVPALKPGYTAWVHARWPANPGDNIIIQMHDGQAFVKELVRRTEKHLVCKQYNPEEEIKYDQAKVKAVHLVVGSGRGR